MKEWSVEAEANKSGVFDGAQNALSKMRKAEQRGTGCHLTADEIKSLSITPIGELWSQDDPRKKDKS